MSDQPTTRQELYDRIRRSSKEEVIREEMVRLGFWPAESQQSGDLPDLMARRGELQRQLRAMRTEQARYRDEERLLQAIRKQRMAESRQRRKETKARQKAEREARAAARRQEQAQRITYLGPEVSTSLGQHESDAKALSQAGLPIFSDAASLAAAMGISLRELRFLTFTRVTSSVSHYVRFAIPKKSGGERLISAPMDRLKKAQHWVLRNVLDKVEVHEAAHGFRLGRSIVSNAEPHVGRRVVVNLDLKDFFPTVTYRRVWGQFRALGYSPEVRTLLSLLCTEPEVDEVLLDDRRWFVQHGERRLPQGAPTSPAITNIICRRLDRKLTKLSAAQGFLYTRYADDLSFSSDDASSEQIGKLLRRLRYIVAQEGFEVHPDKTRVLRRGARQEVTGLVVNDKVAVDRKTLRRFKATLFQIEKDGLEGKSWGQASDGRGDLMASIIGFANYVAMVDPAKGKPLQARVKKLAKKLGYRVAPVPKAMPAASPASPTPEVAPEPTPLTDPAAEGDESESDGGKKKKPWWKLW